MEDLDIGETPLGVFFLLLEYSHSSKKDFENDEEDQILSVSINKVTDLEKINNPEITHLEIVSY